MRGCWFVKHVKTSQDKSVGEIKVAAQPTRAKVANQHAQSKALAKEKALWNVLAAEEVVAFENDEPIDESSNTMDIDEETEANDEY